MTNRREQDLDSDAFLLDLTQESRADDAPALGLQRLSEALPAVAPSADLRARLLDDARPQERLARFAGVVAELLDVGIDHARRLIERIDDATAWSHELPGI
jgi:hypothetical protein